MPFDTERSGIDRRQGGEHCDMHKDNTAQLQENAVNIAGMSSSLITLKWVAGIGVTISMAVVGTFYSLTLGYLNSLSTDMKDVKNLLNTSRIEVSSFTHRLTIVERDIEELKEAQTGRVVRK